MQHVKCVVVGDGNVGKTCLLISYTTNSFQKDYIPTVFDNYTGFMEVDGHHIEIGLWDTSGQTNYERLRPLSYPNTDVFLICFALNHRDSFVNVEHQWIPEIRHYCPATPFVLVGTKLDTLPVDNIERSNKFVSHDEARNLARKYQGVTFVACSAKTFDGLTKVFEEAVKAVIIPGYSGVKPRRKMCVIL